MFRPGCLGTLQPSRCGQTMDQGGQIMMIDELPRAPANLCDGELEFVTIKTGHPVGELPICSSTCMW